MFFNNFYKQLLEKKKYLKNLKNELKRWITRIIPLFIENVSWYF